MRALTKRVVSEVVLLGAIAVVACAVFVELRHYGRLAHWEGAAWRWNAVFHRPQGFALMPWAKIVIAIDLGLTLIGMRLLKTTLDPHCPPARRLRLAALWTGLVGAFQLFCGTAVVAVFHFRVLFTVRHGQVPEAYGLGRFGGISWILVATLLILSSRYLSHLARRTRAADNDPVFVVDNDVASLGQ